MSKKCTDYSIKFSSTDKSILEKLQTKLDAFFDYNGHGDWRNWANILLNGVPPVDNEGKLITTDDGYRELMEYVEGDISDDLGIYQNRKGDYSLSYGDSGGGDDWIYVNLAHICGVEFESSWYPAEPDWEASEGKYKDGVYQYWDSELTDAQIIACVKKNWTQDDTNNYGDINVMSNDDIVSRAYEFEMTECLCDELRKDMFRYKPIETIMPSEKRDRILNSVLSFVVIDCETNYLDNLKSFVDSNITMPKLDEHLVKSGLFKTTVGTEKRRRIEVEVNGVKLFADSKPGVKQRKRNVKKLTDLLNN